MLVKYTSSFTSITALLSQQFGKYPSQSPRHPAPGSQKLLSSAKLICQFSMQEVVTHTKSARLIKPAYSPFTPKPNASIVPDPQQRGAKPTREATYHLSSLLSLPMPVTIDWTIPITSTRHFIGSLQSWLKPNVAPSNPPKNKGWLNDTRH